eukprot:351943-Chlamydomonas_euryale.AAC.3
MRRRSRGRCAEAATSLCGACGCWCRGGQASKHQRPGCSSCSIAPRPQTAAGAAAMTLLERGNAACVEAVPAVLLARVVVAQARANASPHNTC